PPSVTQIYTLSLHDALPISSRERFARTIFRALLHRGHAVRDFRRGDDVPDSVGDPIPRVGRSASGAVRFGFDGIVPRNPAGWVRSEEHTSELQSRFDLVCRL